MAIGFGEFRRGPDRLRAHQPVERVVVLVAREQQLLLLDQQALRFGQFLVGQLVGIERLAVRPRAIHGAELVRREDAHQRDVLFEARVGREVAGIFLVQQKLDRADVLLGDLDRC